MQRVSKILAARGVCSRREAERLIEQGLVTVDGDVVVQGAKASESAEILVAEAGREQLAQSVTIVLHKPVGVVSTLAQRGQKDARRLVRRETAHGTIAPGSLQNVLGSRDLAVAGRLDMASRGLLILTDDGVVARALIGGNRVPKRYVVTMTGDVSDGQIERLNRPMRLDDRQLLAMKVGRVGRRALRFELVEGMKHQIRRCAGKVGLEVTDLLRDGVGPVDLGDLPAGRWRLLSQEEVATLRGPRVSPDA